MKNRYETIQTLMAALECSYEESEKAIDSFMLAVCPTVIPTVYMIEAHEKFYFKESNHPHGWYRKFEKPNKRK